MADKAKVIATAKAFVDKKYVEGKSDDTMFGKWYGMNHAAWCAMFVSYCFAQGDASPLVAASTKKGFASCTAGANWFKKHGALLKAKDAQPGDVVFMAFDGDLSDADHVGICYKVDHKKKLIYTYEGNTSPTGSQDRGQGVYAKVRPYSLIVGIGRPKWPETASAEAPQKPVQAPAKVITPATPPKPVKAPVAPVVKSAGKTYVVKAGDSYWRIAEHHPIKGFSTSETTKVFQKLNNNKPLHPGDIIKIK